MSDPRPIVAHDEQTQHFTVIENGATAELAYRLAGDHIVFLHTGVPAEMEGRGIGSALAKAGLEYAREHELKVIPLCPFVRSYIERKPEYQSLVQKSSGGFA